MLERVAVCDAHEGPVVIDGVLYATSVRRPGPRTVILRIPLDGGAVEELATGAVMANGMTRDANDRLVVCEQGDLTHDACISRIDPVTLEREIVADRVDGALLSSPNDVVVGADGAIWFTDPHDLRSVRSNRPDQAISTDSSALGAPQPDTNCPSRSLLLTQRALRRLLRTERTELRHRRVLATLPGDNPDGLKVDAAGCVYVSCAAGVLVLSPDGSRLGLIDLPGAVNFAFGDNDVLYVTADTAVWAASSIHPTMTGDNP